MSVSLNQEVFMDTKNSETTITYSDIIPDKVEQELNEAEFMLMINSIKDKEVRNLLIVTSYLVCNLSFLKSEYIHILESSDNEIKDNLHKLYETVKSNDDIDVLRADNKSSGRKKKISVSDVITALKMNIIDIMDPKTGEVTYRAESVTSTLQDIREYLKSKLSLA